MSKNKLNIELSFEFLLIGLISTVKEYKLAWSINKALDIQLVKAEDIHLEFFKGSDMYISNYLFTTENSLMRLLRNKTISNHQSANTYLLTELNRFDYFITIEGFEDTFTTEELKEKLQAIKDIQYLQFFDPNDLKSKENLIF